MNIQEQITALRAQASISGYHSLMAPAADTMEALLKDNERLKKLGLELLDCKIEREEAWAKLRELPRRQELLEKVVEEAEDYICCYHNPPQHGSAKLIKALQHWRHHE